MNDQEFQKRVLDWMERSDNWMERSDNWMERTEDWKMQTDNRLNKLEERMGTLQEGLSWIRGKLEGKQESDSALWGKIAVLAALGSAVIALLAYFK